MVEMKDGSQALDERLGRLEEFDERSRSYPVRELMPAEARERRSYTWRVGPPTAELWLDQGRDGSCVGCAFTHELTARPLEIPNLNYSFAKEQVYWEAQKIDPWPGGAYPGASPNMSGTSILAGVKILMSLGYVMEYRWAFGEDELALTVGYHSPAVIGIRWYERMFEPDNDGFIRIGGDVAGGHAVLVNGIDVDERAYYIHNSWGRGWGDGGTAKIGFTDMERLLDENGEACVPMTRARVLG